jgi:glycosyltransferase involved in cell wall biosynthesis
MDEDSFKTTLVCGYCEDNEIDYLVSTESKIPVTRLKGLGRSISILDDLKSLFFLVRLIRSLKPHIIHTHTAKAGVLGRLASLLSLTKSIRIHTFHGHLLKGYFNARKTWLIIKLEKILSRFTHETIAVGEIVRKELLEVGIGNPESFTVIPPGIETPPSVPSRIARDSFGVNDSRLIVSFIGRIEQIKRPDRFLDAAGLFFKSFPDTLFLVAGEGSLLETMKIRAKSEELPVRFLGWRPDIENIVCASDFVVLTSDNEGMPMSLIQASLLGIPSVATNVGSVSEVVKHESTGLVTSTSTQDIVDSMIKLGINPELRKEFGKNAQRHAFENFHVSRLVRDHESIYQKNAKRLSNF